MAVVQKLVPETFVIISFLRSHMFVTSTSKGFNLLPRPVFLLRKTLLGYLKRNVSGCMTMSLVASINTE